MTDSTEYILRQEMRVLQTMNDSKSRQIAYLEKALQDRLDDLNELYQLWRGKP